MNGDDLHHGRVDLETTRADRHSERPAARPRALLAAGPLDLPHNIELPLAIMFPGWCGSAQWRENSPDAKGWHPQERILFNCPEGTQRLMSQNKLKSSNKVDCACGL